MIDPSRRPQRIQRKRTKGWLMPAGAVYVGRPTRWGNPYQGADPERLARLYREYVARPEQAALREAARRDLRGRDLVCWCPLDQPCHADVLLALANREGTGS
ncbi:uncharacterized protein DUF4326 [Rhodothalassium salexigens DSM 2132]|uniref:Uncharacterized protein DUF4326 n=1 Tax=Rhodothalassium salexigens DSM 2132 TaxID=1188247 RepID=A0A4R2PAP8_RHOSA|nr:DUF4326 domain-containing protein [Rhodothalassium salexigens]MBB4212343.1 hypothetical protein [Rhodothalassium salexigens DSM 2132]MBK1640232.1 hypothetical protein [Rhodothalassium salexigens DSM 2132]TCP32027.1 uncharacterized protein DUF4326 [Rhodothalassium salexigens DSM 2132]